MQMTAAEGTSHFVEDVNDMDAHINIAERAYTGRYTSQSEEDNGLVLVFAYLLMSHMCIVRLSYAIMPISIVFSKLHPEKVSCNVS